MKRIKHVLETSFGRDQKGLAMPMAMVMVFLVSVVGAGMLTFVVSDLEASGQVNRGQQAFGLADAGIAIAKRRIATVARPKAGGWSTGVNLSLPGDTGSANVKIVDNPGGGFLVTSTGNTFSTAAKRRVQAVIKPDSSGSGVTAPKNYYAGTNLTMNNYTEMVDGDILVEGNAEVTNALKLTNGDVLVKGYGRFPNVKTIDNGNFFVGGGANFTNTTTVNGGNIFVDGGAASFTNSTTITGGGLYIGDNASLGTSGSEWIRISGGDLYVEGNASSVGNVDISSGGNFLVGGTTGFSGTLKMTGGSFYSGGTTSFQQATISNANIFINGPATFPQRVSITNSVIYTNGDVRFNSSGNDLTGTSIFTSGNVIFSNPSTFGTAVDSYYGNWRNSFNPTARSTTQTGIGATGTITVPSSDNSKILKGTRSFDSTTTATKKFVATAPTGATQITFPFSRTNPPHNALRTTAANKLDAAKIDATQRIEAGRLADTYLDSLKTKAISQGNYRAVPSGTQELVTSVSYSGQNTWPDPSCYGNETSGPCEDKPPTVVYYKFPSYSTSNKVLWLINAGCTSKVRKGILVVENGDFGSYGTTSGFNGTVVLRNGKFDVTGDYCMNGFVNSKTSFSSSNSSRFNLDDVPPLSELNDPTSADVLSWREVYE